ncbi:hypothetical protein [Desulforhopalus sp. 52FAK]
MPIFESTNTSYVKAAERILGDDVTYLNDNPDMVPQFVNALFQSIEVSLKKLGEKSSLTSADEIRERRLVGNGHDIEKIGNLLKDKLGGVSSRRLVRILTDGIEDDVSVIIEKMIFGDDFESTRGSYKNRRLVYHSELEAGDVQIVQGLKEWLDAVKAVAENIDNAAGLVKRWKESGLDLSFEDWHIRENSSI